MPLTSLSSPFAGNGGLSGLTETDVQNEVVAAVQEAYRSAEINLPGRMLDVNVVLGSVAHQRGHGQPGWGPTAGIHVGRRIGSSPAARSAVLIFALEILVIPTK